MVPNAHSGPNEKPPPLQPITAGGEAPPPKIQQTRIDGDDSGKTLFRKTRHANQHKKLKK
jgi:hypothetical protein